MASRSNEVLAQRWGSSVEILADEVRSQSTIPAHSKYDHDMTEKISTLSLQWLERVTTLYAEPHREYHNMTHIQDVLKSLDFLLEDYHNTECSSSTQQFARFHTQKSVDRATVTLAAFFHDVIYNPKSATNERDSADLFLEFVSNLVHVLFSSLRGDDKMTTEEKSTLISSAMNSDIVSRVEECIIATATHIKSAAQAHLSKNVLLAIFLDADMSILGKGAELYDRYAGAIRKEYEFVERGMYCEKRADILQSFLPSLEINANSSNGDGTNGDHASDKSEKGDISGHSHIFATVIGRKQWEDTARNNITREIKMLRRREIPCESR